MDGSCCGGGGGGGGGGGRSGIWSEWWLEELRNEFLSELLSYGWLNCLVVLK